MFGIVGATMNGSTKLTIRFEAIIFIAGVLLLVGTFGPWKSTGGVEVVGGALKSLQHGGLAFVGGIMAILAALVSYDFFGISELEKNKVWIGSGLGVLGGLLGLAGSAAFFGVLNTGESLAWGVYLSVLASLLVIVSSFLLFRGESSAIPMGLSGRGVSSPK